MARGRPKGALNRKTREAIHKIKESQLDKDGLSYPVRYLLSIVKNPKKPEALRIRCADLVSPYTQPKLSAVELNQNPKPLETEADLMERLKALLVRHPDLSDVMKHAATPGDDSNGAAHG